jgi:hypothetical protein
VVVRRDPTPRHFSSYLLQLFAALELNVVVRRCFFAETWWFAAVFLVMGWC